MRNPENTQQEWENPCILPKLLLTLQFAIFTIHRS
jgi:hypothetical protein